MIRRRRSTRTPTRLFDALGLSLRRVVLVSIAITVAGLSAYAEAAVRPTAPATRPASKAGSPASPKPGKTGVTQPGDSATTTDDSDSGAPADSSGGKKSDGKGGSAGSPSAEPTKPGSGEMLYDSDSDGEVKKFKKVTPEEAEAMNNKSRADAADVAEKLHLKLATLETPHFIIFTDWAPGDHNFLRNNMEQAYAAVSRQFDIPVSQNVFVGKLPVYMFDKFDDFKTHAALFNKFNAENVLGYYMGNSRGQGAMYMWKPRVNGQGDLATKQRQWAYTLVHEFTHAFIARYRSNAFIPRWLHEGLAEVVASGQFPRPEVYPYVRGRQREAGVQRLLRQSNMLAAEDYPTVRTMVETLIAGSRKGFIAFFNDLKDGVSFDDALKKTYHCDAAGFEAAWKKYLTTAK